jgi:murein DD-endopeptidase MepM/ murein hydrolase activator NlpD
MFVLAAVAALAAPASSVASTCWLPPVVGRIADPFRTPACRWCAGNRGIEYSVAAGTRVRAVATGVVTYSGVVAGTRYVVVDIGAGRRVTYGRLSSARVDRGDRVIARSLIGTVSGTLFFGLRVHGVYSDPSPFIGTLVGRPRLIPSDGTAARPAPPPDLRCGRG